MVLFTMFLPIEVQLKEVKPGLSMTESMKGEIKFGEITSKGADFILTVVSQDVENMISDPMHEACFSGTVLIPFLSQTCLTVSHGKFTLFSRGEDELTRLMTYKMRLTSQEGDDYYFDGVKTIQKDSWHEIGLHDTTTMKVDLYEGVDESGRKIGSGVYHMHFIDFMHQLGTIEITDASSEIERLKWKAKFGEFFAATMWKIYGPCAPIDKLSHHDDPKKQPRERRPLNMNDVVREVHGVTANTNKMLLTRYKGGTKGPVMLVHDLGMSSLMFTNDTVETNLVEYLIKEGFDVWLTDCRSSIILPSHEDPSTLDDAAEGDIPAMVDKVIEVTGNQSIQVIGQGIGSLVIFASLLLNQLDGKVRSLIASQIAFQFSPPTSPFIKNPFLIGDEGSTATATNWMGKLTAKVREKSADLSLFFKCTKTACHQIADLYGQLYHHDNINDETHDHLHEQFGKCNASLYQQITQCFHRNRLVDADGKDTYLPDFDLDSHLDSGEYITRMKRLNLPILFINGENNDLSNSEAMDSSYERCVQANPGQDYQRKTLVKYGHLDSVIGKNASCDVFPELLTFLNKYANEMH